MVQGMPSSKWRTGACALLFISLVLFQSTVADIRVVNNPAKSVVTTTSSPSVSRAGQTWNPRWHPGKQSPSIEASKKAAISKLQKSKALAGAVPFLKKIFTYQIPLTGVTICIPIAIPQLIFILRSLSSDQQTALLTYHVIVQRATWKVLRDAEQGATFATFAGSDLIKYGRLNSSLVMLMDKGPLPKPVVIPNLFVNADLVLHAVSEVLVPSDFTGA